MSVSERKLRPIYEALDSRNAKTALKLINAALPKHKDSQLLRVLKGLALIRLDRADEAFKACDRVAAEAPTDEQVLNILSMVYKGSEHVSKLIAAYEQAVEARPQDPHLLQTLLFTQTRALQFGNAQQTAMTLHRLKDYKYSDYPWWIVTCLVLQARQAGVSGDAARDAQKLLMLARGMAKKRLESPGTAQQYTRGAPESGEALRLYLYVLKELKDIEEVGRFLEGSLAGQVYPSAVQRSLAVIASLVERGHRAKAAQAIVQLAEQHGSESWDVLKAYLDFVLPMPAVQATSCTDPLTDVAHSGTTGPINRVTSVAEVSVELVREAEVLMRKLQQAVLAPDVPAAQAHVPLLACVDLESRMRLHGLSNGPSISQDALSKEQLERLESGGCADPSGHRHAAHDCATDGIAAAALVYFRKLGCLASCAANLRRFTSQIQGQARQWLASELSRLCTTIEGTCHDSEDAVTIQRRVNVALMEHDLGISTFKSPRQAEEYAVRLIREFRAAAALQKDLDQKERGIADALVAPAVAALVAAWKMEAVPRPPTYLLKAVLVLEAAQRSRPRSAPIRLAAMTLYGLLGAATSAMESFDALDIKHIQHDTLSGHLALPVMLGALCEEGEAQLLGEARALYENHERDAGDTILMAFKAENWTKVLEFVKFNKRLAASHARGMAYAEMAVHRLTSLRSPTPATMLQAVSAAPGTPDTGPPFELGGLRFNEDLSTRPAWLPPHSGSARLAIPSWWVQAAASPVSAGYGRCWWAISLAAESPSQEAQQHRADSTRGLALRSILPTLLQAALSPEHESAAATLQGCLKRWHSLKSSEMHSTTLLPQGQSALQYLQSITTSIFSAAAAVQATLAADGEQAAEAGQQASQRLRALQHCLDSFFGALVPEMTCACKEAVFTGPAPSVAGAFASEDALWLALCLLVWQQPKQAKKGKRGHETFPGSACATFKSLSAEFNNIHDSLSRGLEALAAQLNVSARRASAVQRGSKVEELCSSIHGGAAMDSEDLSHDLWAWEDRLDVNKVMSSLVWEQTEFVMALQARLQKIQQLL